MGQKDGYGMANSIDPDQTDLDLHCCSDLSVPIDLFHIVISLSLEARCVARFCVTSHAWGKLQINTIKSYGF